MGALGPDKEDSLTKDLAAAPAIPYISLALLLKYDTILLAETGKNSSGCKCHVKLGIFQMISQIIVAIRGLQGNLAGKACIVQGQTKFLIIFQPQPQFVRKCFVHAAFAGFRKVADPKNRFGHLRLKKAR